MKGRGVGTEGLERAAGFIEDLFREVGLEAAAGSYRQPFEAVTDVALGRGNRLEIGGIPARLGAEYAPLASSHSGEFAASVVFVGYGIRAPELGYDDYAGVDVEGKVALAMRYEPREDDDGSPFDGKQPSRWSALRSKTRWAQEAGAQALVLVEPPSTEEEWRLPLFRQRGSGPRAGLPVLQVRRLLIEHMLRRSGHDLAGMWAAIEKDAQPHSLELASAELKGRVDLRTSRVSADNVVGILPGRGELADQVVVIGAHYDHLGLGGAGSRTPAREAVHNGADDNASGVAAMICGVARGFQELLEQADARRTLLVIAFAAEETALGGSTAYTENPLFPLEDTVAMLNLDMLGRLRDGRLHALPSNSAQGWDALLRGAAGELGLEIVAGEAPHRPSAEAPFLQHGVPAVRLSSGWHDDAHTPNDDFGSLNTQGGARIAELVQALLVELLLGDERLPAWALGSGFASGADQRPRGAYLGTIPDPSQLGANLGGVPVASVKQDSPAERAGLEAGDLIVKMAGIRIRSIQEMTYVLHDHRPGETMEIDVLRRGERLRFWARVAAPIPFASNPTK